MYSAHVDRHSFRRQGVLEPSIVPLFFIHDGGLQGVARSRRPFWGCLSPTYPPWLLFKATVLPLPVVVSPNFSHAWIAPPCARRLPSGKADTYMPEEACRETVPPTFETRVNRPWLPSGFSCLTTNDPSCSVAMYPPEVVLKKMLLPSTSSPSSTSVSLSASLIALPSARTSEREPLLPSVLVASSTFNLARLMNGIKAVMSCVR
mmetsp:Transcript_122845/g.358538  ORF Transcript_122845/g.358538 Transcript_122845/m.358538 type:complete len:205 (-) Transcript_122845:706-1320(-)